MAISEALTQKLDALFKKFESDAGNAFDMDVTVELEGVERFLYENVNLIKPDEPLDEETMQEYVGEAATRFSDFISDWIQNSFDLIIEQATESLDYTFTDIAENGENGNLRREQDMKRWEEMARDKYGYTTLPRLVIEQMECEDSTGPTPRDDRERDLVARAAMIATDVMREFEAVHLPEMQSAYIDGRFDGERAARADKANA